MNFFQNTTNHTPSTPLAARLRPQKLEEFFGENSLKNEIQKLITNPRHVIFWGPPGTGKTTLSQIISTYLKMELISFNAVTGGVPELKKIIQEMIEKKKLFAKDSLLFIDEIHRFNKAQQDVLLPYLENGDFLFFGATTEYPQTSLNKAILSRVSLIHLRALSQKNLEEILHRAIEKIERSDLFDFISTLATNSNGDARFALNQLSRLTTYSSGELENKEIIFKELFEFARSYDKNANRHHDVISAFIKSIRGSDPDAALLYLAVMLDGGEDPEFIARRLMILASEDIGLANSQALQIASNAHYVVKNIGMPEARITLSHATIFLALSPKSNSSYLAINEALEYVKSKPTVEVPLHISNSSWEKKNYLYPHDYPNNWVKQDYLPKETKIKFYKPQLNGSEFGLNEMDAKKKGP